MATDQPGIGNRIAPARFLLFLSLFILCVPAAIAAGHGWAIGSMTGFDVAAAAFLLAVLPLLRNADAAAMRDTARRNDANRAMMLAITALTSFAVMAAVASELGGAGRPDGGTIALIVGTLALSWMFGNTVFALHYAHLYYLAGDDGADGAGLDFPDTKEPEYWDFVYFAFTLGMTFQTSDTGIQTTQLRKVVTAHSLLAFVFNLGIVAFTINVLGGG